MRRVGPLIPFVVAAALAVAAAASATGNSPRSNASVRVELQPPVVSLREHARIAVSEVHTGPLEVRLAGATDEQGRALPWRSLRLAGHAWVGTLAAPALHGVYPVVLRIGATETPLRPGRLLRVLEPGTRERPTYRAPSDVARWWVRTVAHGTLVALRAWPRPAFDRRDLRLHRLFVVAYTLPGHRAVRDRLGMFITVFRDGYASQWQLLEATVEP
jgi:hypothetical protein